MSSFKTQMKLAKLIQIQAENENKLEIQRQLLAEQQQFEPYRVFKRLDIQRNGHLSIDDIRQFLNQNQITISVQQCDFIMNEFNSNIEGVITYSEFINEILPKYDRQLYEEASSRKVVGIESTQQLEYEIEWGLSRWFQTIIKNKHQELLQLQILKDSPDFSTRDAFGAIDVEGLSVVNALSLDKFLKKCDILLSDEEFDSYFIKMDKDQDGVINYREFQNNVLQNQVYYIKETPIKNTNNASYYQDEQQLLDSQYYHYNKSTNKSQLLNNTNNNNALTNLKAEYRNDDSILRSKGKSPGMKNGEEIKLVQALKEQVQIDREIEEARKELALKNDFNLLDAFRVLDDQGKSIITQADFKIVLENNIGLFVNQDEVFLFFKRYDKDQDGLLRYSDFCRIVLSDNVQYQDILRQRQPMFINQQITSNIFSFETRKCFKRVLSLCINGEVQAEQLRQKLQRRPQFTLLEAFDYLDKKEQGFITQEEFKQVMEEYGMFLDNEDVASFLKRYDKNLDGKVSYSEFCNEMLPKSPKKI